MDEYVTLDSDSTGDIFPNLDLFPRLFIKNLMIG